MFGEKGSGKTAIRIQLADRIRRHNADNPDRAVFLIPYVLPSFVVAHYLGVPVETRASFDEWTNAIVAANAEGSFESAMDATMAQT